jgi:NAD:arginine ADP-ribosyltransferase
MAPRSGWLFAGPITRTVWASLRGAGIIGSVAGSAKYLENLAYVRKRGWTSAASWWISETEQVAIWTYTSPDGWHIRVNAELWSGAISPEVGAFKDLLNGALSKMYCHPATVYRGYSESDVDFFCRRLIGNEREFPGFTSTTKEADLAFYGNILFIIHARPSPCEDRFPDVERFSALPHEKEVLFPAGTRFKVRAVQREQESVLIELEQVP